MQAISCTVVIWLWYPQDIFGMLFILRLGFWKYECCYSIALQTNPFSSSPRGSAIAKIVGHNVKGSNRFDPIVNMWVFEEMIDGKKLTEIINTEHENVKYLPGHKLPKNVVGIVFCLIWDFFPQDYKSLSWAIHLDLT